MSSRRFNQGSLNQFPGIQEMERRAIERRSTVYDIDEETARQRYALRRVNPAPGEDFPSLEEFQRRAMERRSLANSIDEQVIGSGNTNPVNPLPSQTRPRADPTGAGETTRQTSLTVNAPRHDRMLQQAVAVASALNRAQQSHNNRLEQVSATLGRAQQLHSTAAGLRVQINTTNNQPSRRRATRANMEAFNNFNNRVRANPELLLQPQTFARNGTVNPSIHPQFRSKIVCRIYCSHCTSALCNRGMKAILLGNTKVELYSTDTPPAGVQLVFGDYTTVNCGCRIRDGACLCCGNVVGYHVTQPCEVCLEACNNGHFWMFHADGVNSTERKDTTGTKSLRWAMLGSAEEDGDDGMEVNLEGSDFDGMLCR